MSIRLRLTLWYTGILSVTILLFGFGLYGLLYFNNYNYYKEDLTNQANDVYARIQPRMVITLGGGVSWDFGLQGRDLLKSSTTFYQLDNFLNGRTDKSSNLQQLQLTLPELTDKQKQALIQDQSLIRKTKIENLDFIVYSLPITVLKNGQQQLAGVFQAAVYTESFEKLFALLRIILISASIVTILLAASIGWFLARKALRPIDQVIAAADQIEKGADLGNRINYDGPDDEIGRLTNTINGMLGRLQTTYSDLEEAYRRQRRFVSDASHELRTPLTTIRGNVDLLEKMWRQTAAIGELQDRQQLEMSLEAMHDIAGESERMTRLVNDLLALARADAGFQMEKSEMELKPIVDQVIRRAQLLPHNVDWQAGDLSALEGVVVIGNRDYLQQLLFIFVENAFKYTEHGYVKLDALRMNDQIGVRIEDTGIGMDKEEIPLIFERFYRADPSRGKTSGTGLGLSIAKWIIDEHQGSIEVKTRKDEGSTFVIWLPMLEDSTTFVHRHSLEESNQV
ncbi:HAMP domain-containing histidine kinase [Paenibacillus doosanensis]|uniref:histidine kinase n=1 Tax=Paenibacillus konkukensis TaxID=2020716 RepID=A0ABY4RTU4_9BACL|nr:MULTISPECIES: HAMP domain-containing sensor histidine kinase [Paenibacillus]MCS7462761.1 HAMP domain-containing histidine kinase [Paenibacillus doosanensis]UQZ86026.1 Signal transduction histidine-protein kinase ArlS [Paenibacillus konkukensis]